MVPDVTMATGGPGRTGGSGGLAAPVWELDPGVTPLESGGDADRVQGPGAGGAGASREGLGEGTYQHLVDMVSRGA